VYKEVQLQKKCTKKTSVQVCMYKQYILQRKQSPNLFRSQWIFNVTFLLLITRELWLLEGWVIALSVLSQLLPITVLWLLFSLRIGERLTLFPSAGFVTSGKRGIISYNALYLLTITRNWRGVTSNHQETIYSAVYCRCTQSILNDIWDENWKMYQLSAPPYEKKNWT
jgi:hypothetical protein